MDATIRSTHSDTTEAVQVLRNLLIEAGKIADRLVEAVRVIQQALVDVAGTSSERPTPQPNRARVPKGHFAKIKTYLQSLNGKPASIPAIARATGIPPGSVRTIVYKTRRDAFEEVTPEGSSGRYWKLTSVPTGLFEAFGLSEFDEDGS